MQDLPKIGGTIVSQKLVQRIYHKIGVSVNEEHESDLALTMKELEDPEEVTVKSLMVLEEEIKPQSIQLVVHKDFYNR